LFGTILRMRRVRLFLFGIFIISLLLVGFIRYGSGQNYKLQSPLPDFLTAAVNEQVSTIDLWQPLFDFIAGNSNEIPEVTAKSVLVYDLTENKITYEKNSTQRLPIASLTKVMTAIVALENPKDNDRYKVLKENLVGENSMGLSEGEVLSLEELAYGLILSSGNDSSEVLASNHTYSRENFIKAMNDKAKALGLSDTNFTNPSGLEGDGNQYSTAKDLLVITRFALSSLPVFRKVVSTVSYRIPQTSSHKEFYLENETNLLTSYPGVKGVKTGYTDEAGLCLITYLDYKGHKIIGIILGSDNRRQEMKDLLDYSLKSLGAEPPEHS